MTPSKSPSAPHTRKGSQGAAAAHLATVGVLHHEAQAVVGLEGVLQRLWGRKAAGLGGGESRALRSALGGRGAADSAHTHPGSGRGDQAARFQISASPFVAYE